MLRHRILWLFHQFGLGLSILGIGATLIVRFAHSDTPEMQIVLAIWPLQLLGLFGIGLAIWTVPDRLQRSNVFPASIFIQAILAHWRAYSPSARTSCHFCGRFVEWPGACADEIWHAKHCPVQIALDAQKVGEDA